MLWWRGIKDLAHGPDPPCRAPGGDRNIGVEPAAEFWHMVLPLGLHIDGRGLNDGWLNSHRFLMPLIPSPEVDLDLVHEAFTLHGLDPDYSHDHFGHKCIKN